jgi:hypothetical protein
VLRCLEAARELVLRSGDYSFTQNVQDAIDDARRASTRAEYEIHQSTQISALRDRSDRTRSEFDAAAAAREEAIRELNARKQQELDALQSIQSRQLSSFDDSHACDPPPKFCRWSPEYLNLRLQEKFLFQLKRFTEAHAVKVEADRRESIDRESMRRSWEQAVAHDRQQLLKQQKQQRDAIERRFAEEWAIKGGQYDSELRRYGNALHAIESRAGVPNEGGRVNKSQRIGDLPARVARIRTTNVQVKSPRKYVGQRG